MARLGRALPLAVTLLLASAWAGLLGYRSLLASIEAGAYLSHNRACMMASRLELELRAAGIRRFAARTGRLPNDLKECEADAPAFHAFILHYAGKAGTQQDESGASSGLYAWRKQGFDFQTVDEPWLVETQGFRLRPTLTSVPPPPKELDYLSLPIMYLPGRKTPPIGEPCSAWYESSQKLSGLVLEFLKATGGAPPSADKPFLLTTPFLHSRALEAEKRNRRHLLISAFFWPGLLTILIVGVVTSVLWRPGRGGMASKLALLIPSAIGSLFLLSTNAMRSTCYAMSRFRSSHLSRAERIQLLDEAERAGNVPPDIAARARKQIEDLP